MEDKLYFYKAHCDSVTDGDTMELTVDLGFDTFIKCTVRLEGVDAPETRTKDLLQKEAGLKVREYVKRLIEGKDVYLHSKEFKCKYGRVLGDIYFGDSSLVTCLLQRAYVRRYATNGEWSRPELIYINEQLSTLK